MDFVIIALMVVDILSVILLKEVYDDKSIWLSFWAILVLILPIVNTIVLIYFVTGYCRGFKDFIKELKEARKKNNYV